MRCMYAQTAAPEATFGSGLPCAAEPAHAAAAAVAVRNDAAVRGGRRVKTHMYVCPRVRLNIRVLQHAHAYSTRTPPPHTCACVQVFEYFSTRTPRSVVETRETSVVWNYKLADYEFGKSQAQDMLQHLLTSAIGKSSVDVVRGARSLEVRVYGVNKGISMSRVIDSMSWILGPHAVAFDLVLCIGHFMPRDESIFSYFEGAPLRLSILETMYSEVNQVGLDLCSRVRLRNAACGSCTRPMRSRCHQQRRPFIICERESAALRPCARDHRVFRVCGMCCRRVCAVWRWDVSP